MQYQNTRASDMPDRVRIEAQPDGKKTVRLTDNVRHITEDGCDQVEYDEVVFDLPFDRTDETVESIDADFAAWWEYGTEPQDPPTIEQRVADLEDMFLSMMMEV